MAIFSSSQQAANAESGVAVAQVLESVLFWTRLEHCTVVFELASSNFETAKPMTYVFTNWFVPEGWPPFQRAVTVSSGLGKGQIPLPAPPSLKLESQSGRMSWLGAPSVKRIMNSG